MMKERISLGRITAEALALVDREGFDALTLSNVAEKLDVGPSALYTHLDGLDGLRHLVAVAATDNLAAEVRNAAIGTSGDRAVAAMGAAYRSFALEHPGQFASTLLPPRPDDEDDLARANQSLLDIFVLVYGAMGLAPDASHLAARSTRSAIHGFLALEHTTGGSAGHEAEYQHLLDTLQRGLAG
jgi:AcrR family transcriptional regulator